MNEKIVRKVKRELNKRLAEILNNERLIKIGQVNSINKVEMCVRPEVLDAITSAVFKYLDEILSLGGKEFDDIWFHFNSEKMISSETKKIAQKLYNPIS
jgi:predicted glycosyltransferase